MLRQINFFICAKSRAKEKEFVNIEKVHYMLAEDAIHYFTSVLRMFTIKNIIHVWC